ncbi:MAG: FemAB family PEP-CTERM system-associated protein [Gammaproteobacteria bacterium]|nr:FemAB family PEP-CTERM system-associated protein [Gammaproteobacteria bacterium]
MSESIIELILAEQETMTPSNLIKELSEADSDSWDLFVDAHSDATFFHRSKWKTVIKQAFGHDTYYLYAENSEGIQGVLPLVHIKSLLFGNTLSSMPFCTSGGIVANTFEAQLGLTNAAEKLARKLGVDCLEMRNLKPQHKGWPCKDDLYVNFSKEIDPDPEVNMNAIPRKQRAMVRKAIKAGLVGTIDHNVERFYEAYARSVHALGTPVFSKEYFRILKDTFGKDCDILTITKDGELVASVMSFYFRDQVLPYYGGGTSLARNVKGNDFMYWDLMCKAADRGVRIFDYGRSKKGTGSYSFKKNWGFEPVPLHYEYFLVNAKEIPDINPLNPKYQLFIKMWKKMPFEMTKKIGPHIVKNLG